MERKDFLKTIVAASASIASMGTLSAFETRKMPVATSEVVPGLNSKMKLGISAFSYEKELTEGMYFEDVVADIADIGATGIEILGETHVPGYPYPSDKWIDQWKEMLYKHNLTPAGYDLFVDTMLYGKDKLLTPKEALEFVIKDFKLAKKLGFSIIRQQVAPYPADNPEERHLAPYVTSAHGMELLELAIPYAEDIGVKMCIELHSPTNLKSTWVQSCMELIEKKGTKNLGFCPDLSSFVFNPPRAIVEQQMKQGARKEILDFIISSYQKQIGFQKTMEEVIKMGGNEAEQRFASPGGMYHFSYNDPKDLSIIAPYIYHVHSKFFEITDEMKSPEIPYHLIIQTLKDIGYTGYLSSEYENYAWVPTSKQLRLQHAMLRKLLGTS
jgi:sugar phosphate isomerase/epimerase